MRFLVTEMFSGWAHMDDKTIPISFEEVAVEWDGVATRHLAYTLGSLHESRDSFRRTVWY